MGDMVFQCASDFAATYDNVSKYEKRSETERAVDAYFVGFPEIAVPMGFGSTSCASDDSLDLVLSRGIGPEHFEYLTATGLPVRSMRLGGACQGSLHFLQSLDHSRIPGALIGEIGFMCDVKGLTDFLHDVSQFRQG